jgi:hypothetical protein
MPFVCSKISDGLGNRFFQVAAMLGYSEKYGHMPVFVKEWINSTNHVGPLSIQDYFPEIPTIKLESGWLLMEEPNGASYTYLGLPNADNNVNMKGYFQTEKYFPKGVKRPAVLSGLESQYADFAFLHVRRGDYLLEVCKHHYVDLTKYYRYALAGFANSTTRILVCSDDIDWCRKNLVTLYGDLISKDRWEFLPSTASDFDTLRAMTACGRGGICANSTFSWWGAYWNVGRGRTGFFTMPGTWGYPPLPPVVDIFPEWATVLPV